MGCVGVTARNQRLTAFWDMRGLRGSRLKPERQRERNGNISCVWTRGLDEGLCRVFKLITLQKISSWQQRNHSNRENRPKERNFFRTLSKKGDKMSFFPSLLFWNGNEKSFKTNITKLQSVLPRCQTYNIQALSEIRRQNRCLKTRYLETNFNVKNGILKHCRLKVKKRLHM